MNVIPNVEVQWTDYEFHNSYHGACVVWDRLTTKYLSREEDWKNPKWFGNCKPLWDLQSDTRLESWERAVHMMTFDDAYIMAADFKRASHDIEKFTQSGLSGHWPKIMAVMRDHASEFTSMGFQMASTARDSFTADWDEDKDQAGVYDWNKSFDLYRWIDTYPVQHRG